jgi:hypothetical protein
MLYKLLSLLYPSLSPTVVLLDSSLYTLLYTLLNASLCTTLYKLLSLLYSSLSSDGRYQVIRRPDVRSETIVEHGPAPLCTNALCGHFSAGQTSAYRAPRVIERSTALPLSVFLHLCSKSPTYILSLPLYLSLSLSLSLSLFTSIFLSRSSSHHRALHFAMRFSAAVSLIL